MKCSEYTGRTSATQQRRNCERTATVEAFFLGEWRALCQYHKREYADLPMRKIG